VLAVIVSESAEQPTGLHKTQRVLQRFLEPTPVVALPRSGAERPDLLPLLQSRLEKRLRHP